MKKKKKVILCILVLLAILAYLFLLKNDNKINLYPLIPGRLGDFPPIYLC